LLKAFQTTSRYFLGIYAFWVSFFSLFRFVFILYHAQKYSSFSISEIINVSVHGLYMDLSMAAYFSAFPFLFFLLRSWISANSFKFIINGYTYVLVFISSFLLCIDLEIFKNWGHRLDSAVLPYLKYPAEAFASSFSSPLFLLGSILVFYTAGSIWLWNRTMQFMDFRSKVSWSVSLSGILATALLIIPIRGGFQLSPMNQSSVYFSPVRILNQAAENAVWVFMKSCIDGGGEALEKEYVKADPEMVNSFIKELYPIEGPTDLVLKNRRPNIVLIVWESLTAKVVGSLDGKFPSTPNLDRMARNGVLFSNFYGNGDRSDKGLAAILGSVPALGKISIMSEPNSAPRIRFLNPCLEKLGYKTTFLYGGELEFANMKSFMLNSGFDRIIRKEDFPSETYNSKWGAHDEVVFGRQIEEAGKAKEPFFHALFTLSSHEPFEIPGVKNTGMENLDSLFCRSHRYTDRCLGTWLEKAQKQHWWNNTLVVIVADHGHTAPGGSGESDKDKYHIPMVWFGPAVAKEGLSISDLGSQTDFSTTLLHQLGDTSTKIPFSRDLFSRLKSPFAFFSFRNGSVFLTPTKMETVTDQSPVSNKAQWYRQAVYSRFYGQSKP